MASTSDNTNQKTMSKSAISTLLILPFLFVGCGSDEDTAGSNAGAPGKTIFETNSYSIEIPQDWETIEKSGFTSNVPAEIEVAFRNNIKSEVFTANANIGSSSVEDEISSEDYAKSSLARAKNSLISFTEIKSESLTVGELEGYLTEFEGKQTASEPVIHFKQVHIVDGGTGYSLTIAYLPTEEESVVKNLDEMLDSFALK